jgi:hypothetical protein
MKPATYQTDTGDKIVWGWNDKVIWEGDIRLNRPSTYAHIRIVRTSDVPPSHVMEIEVGRDAMGQVTWLPIREVISD